LIFICPGETLESSHPLEWFRDVIFQAVKESGKNPVGAEYGIGIAIRER